MKLKDKRINSLTILILFVSVLLAAGLYDNLGDWIYHYLYYNCLWSEKLSKFVAITVGILVPIFSFWFVWWLYYKLILLPREQKVKREQKDAYDFFIKSLETIKGNKVHGENVDSKIFFEFVHDKYRIEVSKDYEKDIIRLDWYNNETGRWIVKRYIDFKDEPTIQDSLIHGLWSRGIFPESSGPIKLDDY